MTGRWVLVVTADDTATIVVGPFEQFEDAEKFGERHFTCQWKVTTLYPRSSWRDKSESTR